MSGSKVVLLVTALLLIILSAIGGVLYMRSATAVTIVYMDRLSFTPPHEFEPQEVIIKAGGTVKWINLDVAEHSATAEDHSFNSGYLKKGQSWSFKFTRPGTYNYDCIPHPWMKGKIVVEK